MKTHDTLILKIHLLVISKLLSKLVISIYTLTQVYESICLTKCLPAL